jgi:hypothetical protein
LQQKGFTIAKVYSIVMHRELVVGKPDGDGKINKRPTVHASCPPEWTEGSKWDAVEEKGMGSSINIGHPTADFPKSKQDLGCS